MANLQAISRRASRTFSPNFCKRFIKSGVINKKPNNIYIGFQFTIVKWCAFNAPKSHCTVLCWSPVGAKQMSCWLVSVKVQEWYKDVFDHCVGGIVYFGGGFIGSGRLYSIKMSEVVFLYDFFMVVFNSRC